MTLETCMIDIVVNYHQIPCELTNTQSYAAQEPESVVRSQLDSAKSSVLFNQSLNFDLHLILSFLVVLTIVHTCKYLLYTSNTPPPPPLVSC